MLQQLSIQDPRVGPGSRRMRVIGGYLEAVAMKMGFLDPGRETSNEVACLVHIARLGLDANLHAIRWGLHNLPAQLPRRTDGEYETSAPA